MLKEKGNGYEVHEFNPVIYPYKIWVVVDKEPYIISSLFKEKNGSSVVFAEGDGTNMMDAFVMEAIPKDNSSYGCILYFRDKKDMTCGLIAHESSHAAKYLFSHINADIREHEPFEYVLEFIAQCCYEVKMYKHKKD